MGGITNYWFLINYLVVSTPYFLCMGSIITIWTKLQLSIYGLGFHTTAC